MKHRKNTPELMWNCLRHWDEPYHYQRWKWKWFTQQRKHSQRVQYFFCYNVCL